jgi:hypothetical protein
MGLRAYKSEIQSTEDLNPQEKRGSLLCRSAFVPIMVLVELQDELHANRIHFYCALRALN